MQLACEDGEEYKRSWKAQLRAFTESAAAKEPLSGAAEWLMLLVRPPNSDPLARAPRKVPTLLCFHFHLSRLGHVCSRAAKRLMLLVRPRNSDPLTRAPSQGAGTAPCWVTPAPVKALARGCWTGQAAAAAARLRRGGSSAAWRGPCGAACIHAREG